MRTRWIPWAILKHTPKSIKEDTPYIKHPKVGKRKETTWYLPFGFQNKPHLDANQTPALVVALHTTAQNDSRLKIMVLEPYAKTTNSH